MKLTIQLQLLPTTEQAALLRDTIYRFNEAANLAARLGFEAGAFSMPSIHKLAYYECRDRFGLSAQLVVRAIGKAAEGFARDKTVCPVFRLGGAISYDYRRNLCFKGPDRVSLATLEGRQIIDVVYGDSQAARLDSMKGQCDLLHRDGKFYLLAVVDLAEPPLPEVETFIGIDLGIVNIATDSTGETFSGAQVDRHRKRRATARKQYQRKGTRSAKRRLKKMRGRQARYQKWVNHNISKRLVEKAKARSAGIALEDLQGIRSRLEDTVSKRFRRRLGNWSFHHLRQCIEYKARLAGVPVTLVDPRNSSRTCNECGHCEKGNRRDQATFECKHCGHSTNADLNASRNIRDWATRNLAPKVPAGNC